MGVKSVTAYGLDKTNNELVYDPAATFVARAHVWNIY